MGLFSDKSCRVDLAYRYDINYVFNAVGYAAQMCGFTIESVDNQNYIINLKNKYIDSLRLSVTGKNLLTFTSFTGVDPSTYSTNGLTPGATGSRNYYPTCRQFLVGLQVGF